VWGSELAATGNEGQVNPCVGRLIRGRVVFGTGGNTIVRENRWLITWLFLSNISKYQVLFSFVLRKEECGVFVWWYEKKLGLPKIFVDPKNIWTYICLQI